MRLALVRATVAVCASGALSCALVMGFDGYDTSSSSVSFDTLRGTLDGLDPDAGATVTVNGTKSVVVGNGPFTVEHSVVPDHPFSIVAASPGHECDPATGVAGSGGADVLVHCRSQNAALASLTFSDGVLEPSFDTSRRAYVLRAPLGVFAAGVTGQARAQSPSARIAIGPELVDVVPDASAPLSFPFSFPHDIAVRVTAAADAQVSYSARGAVPFDVLQGSYPSYFGSSLAMSGDTLAIGASTEADAGVVHVFRRVGSTWMVEAMLQASKPVPGGLFGTAVALSGDVLAVGAPFMSEGGEVFIFRRSGSTWTQEAELSAPLLGFTDNVGGAVAISDDLVAVGVPTNPHGSVVVLRRVGPQWQKEATLFSPGTHSGDDFGASVAVLPGRLIVGEPLSNDAAQVSQKGAAYVFAFNAGSWILEASLSASGGGIDEFGTALAASGDSLVVGAPGDKRNSPDAGGSTYGSALVFRLAQGVWSLESTLFPSTSSAVGRYGRAVAFAGDTVIVSAPYDTVPGTGLDRLEPDPSNLTSSGAIEVWGRADQMWSRRAIVARPPSAQQFGYAVATDGRTFVVGAPASIAHDAGVRGPATFVY